MRSTLGSGFVDPCCPVEWDHGCNRGLVGWLMGLPNSGWSRGATLRDVVRNSRKPNDGVLTGGPSWASGPGGVPTVGGSAIPSLTLDGVDDYVAMATAPVAGGAGLTWTVVAKITGSVDYPILLSAVSGGSYYELLCSSTTKQLYTQFPFSGGPTTSASSATQLTDGRWHHLCLSCTSAGALTLYRDGLSVATASGSYSAPPAAMDVGRRQGDSVYCWEGGIQFFAVHNRPLGPGEVYAHYLQWQRNFPDLLRWVSTRAYSLPVAANAYTITADVGSYGLTGTTTGLKWGHVLPATPGAYTLTGTTTGLKRGYPLAAAVGSYTLTGTAANFLRTYVVTAAPGSYSLTGTAAGLKRGYPLAADPGTYALVGTAVNLKWGHVVTAAPGSYTLTGTAANLSRGYPLSATPGSYALTGTAATFHRSYAVAATPGAYVLSGIDVALVTGANKIIVPESGSYTLSGTSATLRFGHIIAAAPGSYALTGTAAALVKGYVVTAAPGSYTLTGTATTFRHGHPLVVAPGVYATTGTAATFRRTYVVMATPGAYALTGAAVSIDTGGGGVPVLVVYGRATPSPTVAGRSQVTTVYGR